jgi:SAM domain (Sterile alpha motif)
MDVVVWLRSLGLERYEATFRENEIDETVLPNLTSHLEPLSASFVRRAIEKCVEGRLKRDRILDLPAWVISNGCSVLPLAFSCWRRGWYPRLRRQPSLERPPHMRACPCGDGGMTLSARSTFSVSTRKTSCSIADGWTQRMHCWRRWERNRSLIMSNFLRVVVSAHRGRNRRQKISSAGLLA